MQVYASPVEGAGAMPGAVVAVAPMAVPAGVVLAARLLFKASWPMAIVAGCMVLPVVWFLAYRTTWGSSS
jgi:hypothetical protein